MIDLTNTELFLELTTIDYNGSFFDLHNVCYVDFIEGDSFIIFSKKVTLKH